MTDVKVENVVASASIGEDIDLHALVLALDGAEYEPEQFPGLLYRVKEPKTAVLIFRSGKIVCTGGKSVEQVHQAVSKVTEKMEAAGFKVNRKPDITIQNIVATHDLKAQLNLNVIAISLGLEKVEYEPEQFPGLVYRMEDPKVVMLFFGSGKVVCTGAREVRDVERAIENITQELTKAGLLH